MPLVAVPLFTALLAAAFALLVFWRWLRRRAPALLAWSIGLAMLAVAAFAGYLHRAGGGADAEYRVFYLFGAILNVAWLGLGTVYLLAPRRIGHAALTVVAVLSLFGVGAVLSATVDPQAAADTGTGFPPGSLPRLLAFVGSAGGSVVLFGGALWSAYRFWRTRTAARRAIANVVIAIAVLIFAVGGTAAFTGTRGILELANLVGLIVLFVGFLLA